MRLLTETEGSSESKSILSDSITYSVQPDLATGTGETWRPAAPAASEVREAEEADELNLQMQIQHRASGSRAKSSWAGMGLVSKPRASSSSSSRFQQMQQHQLELETVLAEPDVDTAVAEAASKRATTSLTGTGAPMAAGLAMTDATMARRARGATVNCMVREEW